jgi:NAD-dependent deacetylase
MPQQGTVEVAAPVVFFTGAGISVGAGLPTYRGTGGLYEGTGLEPPSADDVTPERLPALWERFRPRLRAADKVGPSDAHRAIADLEAALPTPSIVVTQNVDGLHSRAGSRTVIELHGSLRTMRCLDQGHVVTIADAAWPEGGVPQCTRCGSPCRPNVVLFGEPLPVGAWDRAVAAVRAATTIVAIGTSAQVYPAALLIAPEQSPDATRIWVNPETEPPDSDWQWLAGPADDMVRRLRAR